MPMNFPVVNNSPSNTYYS